VKSPVWLTDEELSEALDSIDDRIERVTLLSRETEDDETLVGYAETLSVLQRIRAAIIRKGVQSWR
jgi:hypothetical protein